MTESSTIETIEDLNRDRLTNILRQNWIDLPSNFRGIQSLTWSRLDQGVLSRVHRVTVNYLWDDESKDKLNSTLPTQWIVKLPREDLSLEWMFQAEKKLYEIFAQVLPQFQLPFTVPRMLHGSTDCLIIEGIQDTVCHELISGTPQEKMVFVTKALASLHGATWKSEFIASHTKDLQRPPGMGQRLSPLQKEYLFQQQWRGAVETAAVEKSPRIEIHKFIVDLCQQLEGRRLRDVHDRVHNQNLCCIHGDFNISNLLFPKEEGDGRKPALVDWAAAGFGNPMIDVAFFLILNDLAAANAIKWLRQYHDELIKCNTSLMNVFSFEDMLRLFRWAMLYQWMILVAYDRMSRQLSDGDPQQIDTKMKHFANVNRRAIETMYAIGGFEIDKLSLLTEDERKEARDFSINTPLTI
jgi:thiamine kinase-like enzyme